MRNPCCMYIDGLSPVCRRDMTARFADFIDGFVCRSKAGQGCQERQKGGIRDLLVILAVLGLSALAPVGEGNASL